MRKLLGEPRTPGTKKGTTNSEQRGKESGQKDFLMKAGLEDRSGGPVGVAWRKKANISTWGLNSEH